MARKNRQRNNNKNRKPVNNRPDFNMNEVISIPTRRLNESQRTSKWCVEGRSTNAVTGVGVYYTPVPNIAQGIGANARIGDRIRFTRLDCRCSMIPADTVNQLRLIVLYTENPTVINPFTYLENGPTGTYDVLSMTYPYTKDNVIQVLYDKTWTLADGSVTGYVHEEFSVPLNKVVVYQFGTTTSVSGQLYMCLLSDSNAAPNPQVNVNPKWWFQDL